MTLRDTLVQDLRFTVRTLRRSPGYTTTAVLILALGIGVNTAMFSVLRGVLLKPLPFPRSEELVLVQQSATVSNVADAGISIQELVDYRDRLSAIRDLVEFHAMSFVLLNEGEPDRVNAGVVSANFFNVLGVRPLHGRTFVDRDDDIGAEAVLVLSHQYWLDRFGGDAKVVGRVLQMNNRPHVIVGVLPAFPEYPRANDVYMSTSACPFRAQAEVQPTQGHRSFSGLRVFGRLAAGAPIDRAGAEAATVAASFNQQFAADHERTRTLGLTARVRGLHDELTAAARPLLLALSAATVLVLMIACANVANLALARTVRRGRELAVRAALGAGWLRLVRQLLTESLVLATVGGAAGLALAYVTLEALVEFVGRFTPRTGEIAIDTGVLLFAVATSLLTGLAFGAAPAISGRRALVASMRDGLAQGGDSAKRQRVRAVLVVAQVAVSFVLLVGAALLLESLYRLSAVPLGYEGDRVITASYFGNFSRMQTPAEAHRVQHSMLDRLRATPGVVQAAITNAVPQTAAATDPAIAIDGRAARPGIRLEADPSIASAGYFDVLGVRLREGRDFRPTDTLEAPPVAIINASMAAFWDGANPIAARFRAGTNPRTFTVVGVVDDFRLFGADRDIPAQFYVPDTQVAGAAGQILVRTAADPRTIVPAIKMAVRVADPELPVEDIHTLDELRSTRLAPPAVTTALVALSAVVALAITLAGIAGLIGTTVSQRTREFGLRMALGATRGSVLRLVLGQGLVLVLAGLAIGMIGAYPFSRLLTGFLFNTSPAAPLTYAVAGVVFVVASVAATWAPARRATSIDPLRALRTE